MFRTSSYLFTLVMEGDGSPSLTDWLLICDITRDSQEHGAPARIR